MNRKINVTIHDIANESWDLKGTKHLLAFLRDEADFWKLQEESMGDIRSRSIHQYISSHTSLGSYISQVEGMIEQTDMNEEELSQRIRQDVVIGLNKTWLWSGHSYSEMYVQCNKSFGLHAAEAFIQTVTQKRFDLNIPQYLHNDNNSFFGFVLACEFLRKDVDIFKRRNAEKASLDRLRRQYEQIKGELVENFENFKGEFASWGDATRQKWDDLLDKSSQAHTVQRADQNEAFQKLLKDNESDLSDLKKKYEEDLRYSPSVKYWKEAGKEYKAQGKRWVDCLVVTLVAGLISFTILFDTWLEGQAIGVQLDTIQGVILFGTVLAIFAFLVRTFSRLTFSSYHLMRDADERELLTYLYLSLINEKKVDESSRDIILQALFSRTETGLLTGDSSPTMPNLSVEAIRSAVKQTGK